MMNNKILELQKINKSEQCLAFILVQNINFFLRFGKLHEYWTSIRLHTNNITSIQLKVKKKSKIENLKNKKNPYKNYKFHDI